MSTHLLYNMGTSQVSPPPPEQVTINRTLHGNEVVPTNGQLSLLGVWGSEIQSSQNHCSDHWLA